MRLHGALCSIPLNLICNMSTFSDKTGLIPSQWSMVCVRTELLYAPLPLI